MSCHYPPPPPPAHHPPSSRLSLFCRPSITPSSILPNIQFVLLHFADEAAAHLLSMFQEEDAIFTDSPDAGSPSVCDDALFVEGIEVCKVQATKVEQLLTWAASFAVYAQKTNRKVENAACVLLRFVLGTDFIKTPKKLEGVPELLNSCM